VDHHHDDAHLVEESDKLLRRGAVMERKVRMEERKAKTTPNGKGCGL